MSLPSRRGFFSGLLSGLGASLAGPPAPAADRPPCRIDPDARVIQPTTLICTFGSGEVIRQPARQFPAGCPPGPGEPDQGSRMKGG